MVNRVGTSVLIPVLLLVAGCCLDRPPADLEIEITSPSDGGTVCREGRVEGTTSVSGQPVYVLVHPIKTDTWWVQNTSAPLMEWRTTAYFGTTSKGVGEDFEILAMAACGRYEAGHRLHAGELPKDAVFSNIVTVTRTC